MSRWMQAYTIFGRQQSAAARTLISLLRAKDWSHLATPEHQPRELVA
jgi:hypothetical protein